MNSDHSVPAYYGQRDVETGFLELLNSPDTQEFSLAFLQSLPPTLRSKLYGVVSAPQSFSPSLPRPLMGFALHSPRPAETVHV